MKWCKQAKQEEDQVRRHLNTVEINIEGFYTIMKGNETDELWWMSAMKDSGLKSNEI